MPTVSLFEAYMPLVEASVGNISRVLGFPLEFQQWLDSPLSANMGLGGSDKRFAFVMAKLFKSEMKRIGRWDVLAKDLQKMKFDFSGWMHHHNVQLLLKNLKHDPNYEKKLMKFDSVRSALDVLSSKSKSADEMKQKAFIKFPDGSFWVKLDPDECPGEGKMMQHCGAANHDMYSFRDKQGLPHVTLDYNEREKEVSQMRGKQNSFPDKKYWSAIAAFFEKTGAVLSDDPNDGGASLRPFIKATGVRWVEPAAM